MGRRPHLLRLALGRSADLPPDWKELGNQYHSVAVPDGSDTLFYQATQPDPSDAKSRLLFNEKGRPVDLAIRLRDTEVCKAQNELLRLAVDAFQNADYEFDGSPRATFSEMLDSELEETPSQQASYESQLFDTLSLSFLSWANSLHKRVLLLRWLNEGSIADMLVQEWDKTSPFNFFFSGVPTFLFTNALMVGQIIKYIGSLLSKFFGKQPTVELWEHESAYILHTSMLVVSIPLSVLAQVQQLRLQSQSSLLPSTSLLRHTNNPLYLVRGAIFSVMPAFAVQFLDGQLYAQIHNTISTYIQAYILKPQNVSDDYCSLEGLEALERHFDGLAVRESCFHSRLGVMLPRPMYGILSRTCDTLTNFLGWNGYRVAAPPHYHASDMLDSLEEESQVRVKSDLAGNRPANLAAMQLAHIMTNLITMPIEGILLRSFTWLAVGSPWSSFKGPVQYDLQNNMYSILPRWSDFRQAGVKGTLGYIAKVGFCLGVESCTRLILVACVSSYSVWRRKEPEPWRTMENRRGQVRRGR